MNLMPVPIRPTAFLFALFAPAMALGAPFDPIELSDPELAQLRGRYVLPDHVVHFGVTLTSSWEQSGQQLRASVSLQLQQGIQPVLTVSHLSSAGGDSPAQGSGIVIGGQGLSQVDGISQSVRTAGDLNTAHNDVQISIERNGQAPALDSSGTPLNGSFVHGNALGSATVSAAEGKLRIGIATNGQGTTLQQLGGGLLQDTRILSDQNRVINNARLEVVMQPGNRVMDAINCNLDQLRALRPTGY